MSNPYKIGITGNIGSGKSVVSAILRTMGIPVYDCDTEAKRLMQEDTHIRNKIIETFDKECYTPNNELNKKHLANIIFNSTTALQKIDSIVHPRVKEDFAEWSKKQTHSIVAMESAILFEADLKESVDTIVTIHADREICIQRATRRNNTTRRQVEERLDKQISAEKLVVQSEYAICNNPDTPLLPQIVRLLTEFIKEKNITPILSSAPK